MLTASAMPDGMPVDLPRAAYTPSNAPIKEQMPIG